MENISDHGVCDWTVDPSPEYLCSEMIVSHRKALSTIRLSNHNLEIEKGRYSRTLIDQRICNIWKGRVEDEFRFIIKCNLYNDLRSDLYDVISLVDNNFLALSDKDKFFYIFQFLMLYWRLFYLIHCRPHRVNSRYLSRHNNKIKESIPTSISTAQHKT